MAKETEVNESKKQNPLESLKEIMLRTKKEDGTVNGEPLENPQDIPLTESERVTALKEFFNSKKNAGIENKGNKVIAKIHSIAFNPTEKDTEKVAKIAELLK